MLTLSPQRFYNYVFGNVNGVRAKILVDSGASYACISHTLLSRIAHKSPPMQRITAGEPTHLLSATGSQMRVLGTVHLTINFQGFTVAHRFLVLRGLQHQCVLGIDLLQDMKAVVDFDEHKLSLLQGQYVIPMHTGLDSCNVLRLARSVYVTPNTEAIVQVCLPQKVDCVVPSITEPWPSMQHKYIAVAKTLVQPKAGYTACRILNVTPHKQYLRKGTPIAYLASLDLTDDFNAKALDGQNYVQEAPTVPDWRVNITESEQRDLATKTYEHKFNTVIQQGIQLEQAKSHLSDAQFTELVDLLYVYHKVFITSDEDLEVARLPPMNIHLKDEVPVRCKPFRLSPELDAVLHKRLLKMRDQGILVESDSPYSSPVMVVKRAGKTGDAAYRVVADFRKLNEKLDRDYFHVITNVDDVITKIGHAHAEYYTVLDNKQGYHQLPVAKDSQQYLGISSSMLHLHYARCPMGLASSPAHYQLALTKLLSNQLSTQLVAIYMDDCALFTRTFDAHMRLLGAILSQYRSVHIHTNATKSLIVSPSIKYLGVVFNKHGVSIDEDRCKIIRAWAEPKNVSQVRSFLGGATYFRRFIKNFSILTAPLRKLTLNDADFVWGQDQRDAFQTIKDILCSDVVLAYPRFDNLAQYPFIVVCDGSKNGFGATLLQKQPSGEEKVIMYAGRATRSYEASGTATMLELTCLIQAIEWFHGFLSLAKFIVRSDHFSLTYIKNLKHSSHSKLLRYSLLLSQYDFDIEHIKGKQNLIADAISRRPYAPEEAITPEPPPVWDIHPILPMAAISDAFLHEIAPTVKQLDKSHDRHMRRHAQAHYFMPITDPTSVAPVGKNTSQDSQGASHTLITQAPSLPTTEQLQAVLAGLEPISLHTQADDPYFAEIISYLTDGILPSSRPEARKVVYRSENFTIIDDQLIKLTRFHRKRKSVINPCIKQLCLPLAYRLPVMMGFHDLNHATVEKTYYTIREKYFWPNMFTEIEIFVKGCEACQLNRFHKRPEAPLGNMPHYDVFGALHIDHFGEVHPSSNGKKFVLVMTDHCSGHVELAATSTTSAAETAKLVHQNYYLRFGYIPVIISDRAAGFLAQFTQQLFELCSIRHIRTTSFRPNMNGVGQI